MVGNDIYNAANFYLMKFDGRQNVKKEYLDKYWAGENSTNSFPIVSSDLVRNSRNFRNSDFYVEDGSFIRLRNFQIGYTFSPNLAGTSLGWRIYVASENLFTLTGYSGFEPEHAGIPVDRGTYPQSRLFMLGTSINF